MVLQSGERVRLIGLNSPELGRKGTVDQPLAQEAKHALRQYLGKTIYLQNGEEPKDRYGRRLAYVFRSASGELASEHLIAKGLAWQVVIPPNANYSDCLADAEKQARASFDASGGSQDSVWQPKLYPSRNVKKLKKNDAGFVRITGKVVSVVQSRNAYWITLDDKVAVKLRKSDLPFFGGVGFDPDIWQGKTLKLRGWLSYRGKSRANFAPFTLSLQHPRMLEAVL